MKTACFVRCALPLAALAALSVQAQDDVVPGTEIIEKWAGKELVGTAANGRRVFMRFEADGRASVAVGEFSDTGTWRPHDKGYCATWVQIRKGEERCFTVVRSAGGYTVRNPDGSLSGHFGGIR